MIVQLLLIRQKQKKMAADIKEVEDSKYYLILIELYLDCYRKTGRLGTVSECFFFKLS